MEEIIKKFEDDFNKRFRGKLSPVDDLHDCLDETIEDFEKAAQQIRDAALEELIPFLEKLEDCSDGLNLLLGNEDLDEDKLQDASEGLLPNTCDALNQLLWKLYRDECPDCKDGIINLGYTLIRCSKCDGKGYSIRKTNSIQNQIKGVTDENNNNG